MSIKSKIGECSYLWIVYNIVGIVFAFVIAMAVYLMSLMWSIFYNMDNNLVDTLSQPYIKYVFIMVAELLFMALVIKGLFSETGDTILIDIIKHGDRTKGVSLLGSVSVPIQLSDIKFYLKDRVETVDSLDKLRVLNQMEHGYIKFNNEKLSLNDICFVSDLAIDKNIDINNLVLRVKRYQYKGMKLLSKQTFNTFELVNNSDGVVLSDSVTLSNNSYIARLCNANVYDYPVSLKSDISDGIYQSRVSIAVIFVCAVVLVGIYGWYRNYSSSSFISDFYEIEEVDGITIYTDSVTKYEKLDTFIKDSIVLLPEKLKEEFINDGWSLVFVKNDLADYSMLSSMVSSGETSGCTFPFYKLIVIQIPDSNVEANKVFLMQTIFHEFGHYFALKTDAVNDDWHDIFNEESIYYSSAYAKSSMSEGFASSYANYILYSDFMREKNPKTYDYIDNLMKANNYK
jgi:hypothetical protein